MENGAQILLSLFIVFVAAQVGAELAQRLKLPGVVGEIAAGCAIGPSLLGWISPTEPLEMLAEIGVVLLLFAVGLETRLDDLRRVGRVALLVGILGVIVPFVMGTAWAHGNDFDWSSSMFIAAAFVATSAGITARVLQELNVLQRIESRVILGAAVIDDVLAMLLLGVVVALQAGDGVHPLQIAIVLGQSIAFIVVIALAGTHLMKRKSHWLERMQHTDSALILVLVLCLGLAWAATTVGLAAIIGAFLAGMIAAESRQREKLEAQTQPLLAFLTPFFFVITGTKVDLGALASGPVFRMLVVVTLIATASKLIGGYLGALSLGRRGALIVGLGMVPRGEIGIVIAALGLSAGVFAQDIYSVIVGMSLLTAIITPPLLALLMREPKPKPAD